MESTDVDALRAAAAEFLIAQLRERAPASLQFEAAFDEQTLEGEGRAAVLSFDLPAANAHCEPGETRHYVVVGQTAPNYYPAYGLGADDAFSLHVGTRFMLAMQIGRVEPPEPVEVRSAMQSVVASIAGAAAAESAALAGLFACEEQRYAVYRVAANGEAVYFVCGDCPPGFYRLAAHPPQVALRLHLGKVIRAEPHMRETE